MLVLQISTKIWGSGPGTVLFKMTESYAFQPKYKLNQKYSSREMWFLCDFVCLHGKIKWHFMLPNLGIIKLRRNPPPNLKGPQYTLNITAIDDNASGGPTRLSSFAEVIVGVNDINNNKPVFREVRCLSADIFFPSIIGVIDSPWLVVVAGGLKGLCVQSRMNL